MICLLCHVYLELKRMVKRFSILVYLLPKYNKKIFVIILFHTEIRLEHFYEDVS